MTHPMRPETIARRAAEHVAERERSHADLVARLAETRDSYAADPDRAAFWADLLAEHRSRCDRCLGAAVRD